MQQKQCQTGNLYAKCLHFYLFIYFLEIKIWNASRICVSSMCRGHANLLCIVPILVHVLPKWAQMLTFLNRRKISSQWSHFTTYGTRKNKKKRRPTANRRKEIIQIEAEVSDAGNRKITEQKLVLHKDQWYWHTLSSMDKEKQMKDSNC